MSALVRRSFSIFMSPASNTERLASWIERLKQGDQQACNFLLEAAQNRLLRLTRKMLNANPVVRRWEQTDDVFQNASLRLHRALATVIPESTRHFLNLAALQIRRELIDLTKHYAGPEGIGANHATGFETPGTDTNGDPAFDRPESSSSSPSRMERWAEFHHRVELLPDEEREVFNLLWYDELSQPEAAQLLGISERTLQRRWQRARLHLSAAMQGNLPD